jgi:DedD protein
VNNLHDDTDDEDDRRTTRRRQQDREITLGTTMILLIFFALAVYGAALFGFGYSLGSKHTGSTAAVTAGGPNVTSGGFKPSPGSPVGSASANRIPVVDPKTLPSYTTPPPPQTAPQTKTVPLPSSDSPTAEQSEPKPKSIAPVAAVPTVASQPTASATSASGPPIVVQVAALSQQADAEMIATTLQRRGYAVSVHTEADKFFHVQVGPFYARKDAEAMKAKLLADGFNAYIK